jgi:hypothetical protein
MFDLGAKPEGEALEQWNFRQLLRHSAVIARLYHLYTAYELRNGTEAKLLRGEEDATIRRKIVEIGKYIDEFAALARAERFSFVLVVIPVAEQIGHGYPHARYQSILEQYAARDHIPYLDLLPVFDRDYRRTGSRHQIPFDGHYDARANQLMAESVAGYLEENGNAGCPAQLR